MPLLPIVRAGSPTMSVAPMSRRIQSVLSELAQRLLRPDPNDSPVRWAEYRALVERSRFAVVFTAHPTFALPPAVAHALVETASGRVTTVAGSHRPPPISLADEFAQATAAIANGRDAIDWFNAALLSVAHGAWPDRWTELDPRPVILSSWVGYDTDGRTDIGWWDTLRLRLEMKRRQLARLHAQVTRLPSTEPLAARTAEALDAVGEQLDLCPDAPDPARVAAFAQTLIGRRDAALTSPLPLLPLFEQALAAAADDAARQALCVARAGLVSHGLALAHTHVRLNAAQIHNAVRQRLGIADAPEDPAHRRALFGAMNAALDAVQPVSVDFGALLAEQASAIRLMMTIVQIIKHVDGSMPVRFLIAETETGYTCLPRCGWRACTVSNAISRSVRCSRPPARWSMARRCWKRRCAARTTAPICKPPDGSRCSSATRIPAAMSASSPPAI